eukprot:TRINITY_DN32687_c0_g1_i1.p1 TRINITY_DN32687_c0_g1~~TRINITY_DN32687_c0_g1_i1.p1  ORF type:complete len:1670 (-),score=391.58 TRINITY_DN32687_c0_g1_i1:147-5156(-)
MVPHPARDRERSLPDLSPAASRRLSSPGAAGGKGGAAKQVKAQAETFANASASAHAACEALRSLTSELQASLAKGAGSLSEWQRLAFSQAGQVKAIDEMSAPQPEPWAAAVRCAQELGTLMAALQAEVNDAAIRVQDLASAQSELEAESRRWLQAMPREAASQRALEVLQQAGAIEPLGGETPLLRELRDRHPDATLLRPAATDRDRGQLPMLSPSPMKELLRDSPGRGYGTSRRALSFDSTQGSFAGGVTRYPTEEKTTWACTAARLAGAEKLLPPRLGQKGKATGKMSRNTSALELRDTRATMLPDSSFYTTSSSMEMDAELNATKAALDELRAENALLKSRFRDKAAPVTIRLGGGSKPSSSSSSPGLPRQRGGFNEAAMTCTRMKVRSEGGSERSSEEDEAEMRRLKYQLEDTEKDLARAHRFLAKSRQEITETNKANEDLRAAARDLRRELNDAVQQGLVGRSDSALLRELKRRGVEFSSLAKEGAPLEVLPETPRTPEGATPPQSASPPPPPPPSHLKRLSDPDEAEVDFMVEPSFSKQAPPSSQAPKSLPPGAGDNDNNVFCTEPPLNFHVKAMVTPQPTSADRHGRSAGHARRSAPAPPALPAAKRLSSPSRGSPRSGSPGQAAASRGVTIAVQTDERGPPQPSDLPRRKTIPELWQVAREFAWRLVAIGGEQSHIEYKLHKIYDEHEPDFHDKRIGLLEHVSRHARREEFNRQVKELLDYARGSKKQAEIVREASSGDLKKLEAEMAKGYDKAYEKAGGLAVAKKHFAEANEWLGKLRRKRGTDRFRQDAGFELLGLDAVYETTRKANEKLGSEVMRIATETVGKAYHAKLKGRVRARAKVLTKYGNNAACLTDVMRASIVYPTIDDLYAALKHILKQEIEDDRRDFGILEAADRFQDPKDGYRDVSMLVIVDGVIGEVQLHLQQIKDAKSGEGHDAYKLQRQINETLFEACVQGDEDSICALAKQFHASAVAVRDKNGRSALHYACQIGSSKAVRVLLANGANPWAADDKGILPCEVALKSPCESGCSGPQKALKGHITKRCRLCGSKAMKPYDFCTGTTCQRSHALTGTASAKQLAVEQHEAELNGHGGHTDAMSMVLAAMLKTAKDSHAASAKRLASCFLPWWVDFVAQLALGKTAQQQYRREQMMIVGRFLVDLVRKCAAQKPLEAFLLESAERGLAPRVRLLLQANFDEKPVRGQPSVMDVVIQNGHEKLALELSEMPRTKFRPHGFYACTCNCSTLNIHLQHAARDEDHSYAKTALAAKADPNAYDAFLQMQRTPLMAFAAAGDMDMCRKLIERRASLDWHDKFGCDATHYALAHQQYDLQIHLQKVKVVVELPRPDESSVDYLKEAVRTGCSGPIYRFLRANGAIHEKDKPRAKAKAPARPRGRPEPLDEGPPAAVVELLNQRMDDYGRTLLHMCIRDARECDPAGQVCRVLLHARADPALANNRGDTVLHHAAERGNAELYSYLLEAIKLEHGQEKADLMERTENMHGQAPREYLLRSINRGALRRAGMEEPPDPHRILKRVGLMAFKHVLLTAKLDACRESEARTWFEIIMTYKGDLKEELGQASQLLTPCVSGVLSSMPASPSMDHPVVQMTMRSAHCAHSLRTASQTSNHPRADGALRRGRAARLETESAARGFYKEARMIIDANRLVG